MQKIISFKELREKSIFFDNDKFSLDKFLPNHEIYLAHQPTEHQKDKKSETLEEHLNLVLKHFFKIVDFHNLELVIDKMIDELIPSDYDFRLKNFVKELFMNVIIYHDFGKVNHLFQEKKMKNFDKKIKQIKHKFKHYHSGLGAYLFAIHHHTNLNFEEESQEESLALFLTTIFTYPILKHHSKFFILLSKRFSFLNMKKNFLNIYLILKKK